MEEKQTATMSLTKVWLCNDYFQSEPFSVKCSIWWACKQTDSPASDQRQVTVKNLHRSFRNREAIYFRTREDYNGNFLDGLERRKLQKKVQISHLFDGRHFFSWRGSGLEKSLASVSQPITITGFPSLLTETQNVFSLDCLYLRLIWRLGSVYTGPDKFLQEQKLAQFYFAFTRDRRNWTNPKLAHRKPGQRSTPINKTSMSSWPEPAIWLRETDKRILSLDTCQLIITWMSNILPMVM